MNFFVAKFFGVWDFICGFPNENIVIYLGIKSLKKANLHLV